MSRHFDRHITIEQAAAVLKVDVREVLAMLRNGLLHVAKQGSDNIQLISRTEVELARKRLENSRRLDGDVQQ